ncbi:AAA family ATPase [Streptomyces sp. NPDC002513]
MTAPLTPPPPPQEQPPHSSHDGWQAVSAPPEAGPAPHGATGLYGADGPGMKTELREAAVITVALALAGVLLGVLWPWLSPRVPLVGDMVDNAWVVYLKDTEGEQAIGVDGTFTLLALGFGVISALVVFLLRKRGGVPLVAALALGGLLGSLLAWRVGVWLGPSQNVLAHAKAVGKGVTFSAPLKLGAKGALLAWSVAALVVHLGLTALFGPRDPDPYATPYGPSAPPVA